MRKVLALVAVLTAAVAVRGQSGPNADATYMALRNLSLGTEAVSVLNFDLKRDAGTFRFKSGTVCFSAPERMFALTVFSSVASLHFSFRIHTGVSAFFG